MKNVIFSRKMLVGIFIALITSICLGISVNIISTFRINSEASKFVITCASCGQKADIVDAVYMGAEYYCPTCAGLITGDYPKARQ